MSPNNLSSTKIQYIDLEMLCWESGEAPAGQSKHIIQIGIVEVDSADLKITRSKNYYIRPKDKNFECSEYCATLTGITKDLLIKEGRNYSDTLKSIQNEFGPSNKVTYAWGSDNDPIIEHCKIYNCENPWGTSGIWDFGVIFQSTYSLKKKMTLGKALEHFNVPFRGRPHSAIDDAGALADLHMETIRRIRNG